MNAISFFAAVLLAAPGVLWGAEANLKACKLQPYFDCVVPSGWGLAKQPDYYTKVEKVYGLEVLGPRAPSGSIIRIGAHYYAPDNGVHKSAEKFIRVATRQDGGVALPGEKGTPPERAKFKGVPATRFTLTTFDFIRTAKDEKQVTIIEDYLVIPAKAGFYVLEYTAPPALVREYRPVFEKFKESFTMLVK